MRINDQESAFAGKEPPINPIAFYFAVQLFPYLVFILSLIFKIRILQISILIILGISFWFIQNVNGIQLVGLRWEFSLKKGFEYYSKPNPFVPRAQDSNSFWMGFFIFMLLWFISFIISIFISEACSIVSFIGFFSEFLNLIMFAKSHISAKNQAEHATLEILQDENINFELVHSDDEENREENNVDNYNNEGQLDEKSSDKNNNNNDFYPNEQQNENENNANNNDHEEINLPTFDMPEDNELNSNSNEEEKVHFELVDEKDD